MSRTFTYSALILRVRPVGESNREAWFLTPGEGILKATLYGGPKSRRRATVAPFHSGNLMIYYDPVRDTRKISDFDVTSFRTGLHELLERAMTAGALAETILASHGGGSDWPRALALSETVLDTLDSADAPLASRLAVYFYWHWAGLLGAEPSLTACTACACEARRDEVLWYNTAREALYCENCRPLIRESSGPGRFRPPEGPWIRAGAGARLWLQTAGTLAPGNLARVSLDSASLGEARTLSHAVLAAALGRKLPTWEDV